MIFQSVADLGYNPPRVKLPYQQEIGDALVEGSGHIIWARGGKAIRFPVAGWVKVDQALFPIFSDGFEGLAATQTLWKSIGTDATGTLAWWTIDAGTPSIASNLATIPAGAALRGGHADWWDGTATMRFVHGAGAQPSLELHANGSGGSLGCVRARVDGSNLHLDKIVAGAATNDLATTAAPAFQGAVQAIARPLPTRAGGGVLAGQAGAKRGTSTTGPTRSASRILPAAPSPVALTPGTAYWLTLQASGTTYTATVFADNAGVQGAAIATVTAIIADAALQSGQVRVENPGSGSFSMGGAFAGVFAVTGSAPSGWTTNVAAGEPAFAWSKVRQLAGTFSASINLAATGGNGYWSSPAQAFLAQTIYRITGQAFITTGSTLVADEELLTTGYMSLTAALNAWTPLSADLTNAAAASLSIGLRASGGTGTAYFDQVALLSQQLANELVCHQLEEIARNGGPAGQGQQPLLVNWSSLRALPQDGWFLLEDFTADYQTTMGGAIKFTATMAGLAPASAGPQLWWAGGQRVGTSFSATPMDLVSAPPNSQGIFPLTRVSADGNLPTYVFATTANTGVLPVQWSATISDRFKGRVRVYDVGGLLSTPALQVPTNGTYVNPNWTEVRAVRDHNYLGDMVLTNGLLLVTFPAGGSVSTVWLWNKALSTPAWQQICSVVYNDAGSLQGTLRALAPLRVGTEEAQIRATSVTAANAADVLHKLQRGRYDLALNLKGRTQAAAAANALQLLTAFNGAGFVWNSAAAYDQLQGAASALTGAQRGSDFPFAALVFPDSRFPFICGVCYNLQPTQQPGILASGGLNFGDTVNPSAMGLSVDFGLFAVPWANPQQLREPMSAAALSGGFVAVNDSANGPLATNVAKQPSGTLVGAVAMGPSITLPAGSYLVFARVRSPSASSTIQLRLGLYDLTSGWVAGQFTDYSPSQLPGPYGWLRVVAGPFTINAAHQQALRAEGVNATAAGDAFVDEMWVVPMSVAADLSGPADVSQQFLFDRTVRFPVL